MSIFVPKKVNVGFQNRKDTYTGKLAYVIYFDETGKLRKEPSWQGWRDKQIPNEIYDNEPIEGFVLKKKGIIMANKNDERIMKLREEISERRKSLAKKPAVFHPVTNCLLTLHGVTYNLHVNTSKLLLVKLNALKLSAEDLGISTEEIPISGYPLDCWIADVQNYLQAQQYKQEKAKLDSLEKQLTALLSSDKQTELQIDDLEAMLKS